MFIDKYCSDLFLFWKDEEVFKRMDRFPKTVLFSFLHEIGKLIIV
jgi:hypothetical protein